MPTTNTNPNRRRPAVPQRAIATSTNSNYRLRDESFLGLPTVNFDPSGIGEDPYGYKNFEMRPDYFDTLKRVFVLLDNDAPLGREIHRIVQGHFDTGAPAL